VLKEILPILEARINALPDAYRAVFVLRAVEQLSVEETAAALELAQATVRRRYARAHSLVRESLARDVDLAVHDVFDCAGERCDRIVDNVMNSIKAGT
jgi:RNA polymerase sigma-70 factor (ECF subfamily)